MTAEQQGSDESGGGLTEAERDRTIQPWQEAAQSDGWDADGDVLYWAAVDAIAWALIEASMDTADREPSAAILRDARSTAEAALATARREVEEMRAVAESIAYEHAATVDGEFGCCHDEDELRAGGREAAFDGDEFEPIPDDCPGKETLDRHLAALRAALANPSAAHGEGEANTT